jgi:hypothetical protein
MLFTGLIMLGKLELLAMLAAKNRGLLATESEKQAIAIAVAQLEDDNPTPRPMEALDWLEGNWRLVYTTSRELLRLDRVPGWRLGEIYQCIRAANAQLYNIAELMGLPLLEGIVSVVAQFDPVSERRVEVKFTRAIWGSRRVIGYENPDSFIADIEAGKRFWAIDFPIPSRDRNGWLDITYLDQDLRIGRGNEGSIFVLKKQSIT